MRLPLLLTALVGANTLLGSAGNDWSVYLGDKAASHYSTLDQITPANVTKLEVAWTFHTGDAQPDNTQIQCNPLVIDGVLYGTTPQSKLFALDATTGREIWRFEPLEPNGLNRGIATWAGDGGRRLLFGNGHWLHAIDAATGKLIESFGDHGRVDLQQGFERDVTGLAIQANTPGVVFHDLIIIGMRCGEGPAPAAPGDIRAYNVRTGELVWRFHTVPHPGEFGYDTWPADAWQRVGGANVWTGMTLDEQRGIVFCPVGSAAFDFWGGDRHGDNLFADCLLALDAATGKRIWHFQLTRHDIWDRDPPSPPTLLTVHHDGRDIPAVAQVTKQGVVYVLNRETGEPLFPMEEVAVPTSDLAGELTAPTQRLPLKPAPFARQLFTVNEITNRTPEAHRAVLERFSRIRPHTLFQPPSVEGTIIFPGFDGGGEWGGAAADPKGVLYVNANEMAWILAMIETGGAKSLGQQVFLQNCAGCHGPERKGNVAANIPSLVDVPTRLTRDEAFEVVTKGRRVMPPWGFLSDAQRNAVVDFLYGMEAQPSRADTKPVETVATDASSTPAQTSPASEASPTQNKEQWVTWMPDHQQAAPPPYTHTGYNRWLDPDGYPAVKPPWGTLNAIDLNTGEYLWKIPLGELPELTAQGIPPTGTENYGGPVVTASGLLFIGASKDGNFRAIDTKTGRELWRTKLPAGGYATPATYSVNGRQYVVIACGGGKMDTPSGDAYVAFALPE